MEKFHGVNVRSIEHWENGKVSISALKLVKYIKIFEEYGIKLSLDALLNFDEEIKLSRELRLQ